MTLKDIPIGGLFITGPSRRFFVKIDDKETWGKGGNCFDLASEDRPCWIPNNRCVEHPKRKDFLQLAKDYRWEKDCEGARKALTSRC